MVQVDPLGLPDQICGGLVSDWRRCRPTPEIDVTQVAELGLPEEVCSLCLPVEIAGDPMSPPRPLLAGPPTPVTVGRIPDEPPTVPIGADPNGDGTEPPLLLLSDPGCRPLPLDGRISPIIPSSQPEV